MLKKLKAIWHALIAVTIASLIIILLSVTIPILLGIIALGIVIAIGYITYLVQSGKLEL